MTARVLSIDFETASLCDLKRCGVYVYADDPSTRVLCMAWAFDNDPVQVWREGEPFPYEVMQHVASAGAVRAWNAAFEWNIWNRVLLRQIGCNDTALHRLVLPQLYDTMAVAANFGLPLSLDMAAHAAHVPIPKDKDGHSLMLRMCRPRKINPDGTAEWWHETDPAKFDRLCAYCATDVEAERAVANSLPPMSDVERQTWELDQRINARGVGIDTELVLILKALATAAAQKGNADLQALTRGAVSSVNAHAALLAFVQSHGFPHDTLRRATVEARLDEPGCIGIEREALSLRADVARTSAAKLDAMLAATSGEGDNRGVRGMLQYYGAFRTGRWAGRLIQLQNMPRGVIDADAIPQAVKLLRALWRRNGPGAIADALPHIEAVFGPAMGIVASLLRACLRARNGKKLVAADFAQIEARVLPWLAGQESTLAVFRGGGDIYAKAAAGIFGYKFPADHHFTKKDVTSAERQIGKVAVLALGFGGGVGAFQTMASAYGVVVPDAEADNIKVRWRSDNPQIVQFWWALDAAARAVLRGAPAVDAGPFIRVGMWGGHLIIRLPSNRPLVYRDARLEIDHATGDESITYMGLNQYTRKWERLRTYGGKLTENVVQATARDVMRDAMLALDRTDTSLVLTVHDELIAEPSAADADGALADILSRMGTPPAWAPGLPVAGDGWVGEAYRK